MADSTYQVTDRRPIAARRFAVVNTLAAWLAGRNLSANLVSVAGMICGVLAGVSLYFTGCTTLSTQHILWIAAAILIQLRLLANLLDGMVAIASATASQLGELFNDAPDRVSDSATLIGLGYATGGLESLGYLAALLAVLTAYVRLLGKASGAGSDFRGPMAKQHRMFLATLVCLYCAGMPVEAQHRAPTWCLAIILAGCIVTAIRRLHGIAATLRSRI